MLAHDWMRLVANFKFQIVEDVFRSRVPDILQWVLRFTYGVSKGAGSRGAGIAAASRAKFHDVVVAGAARGCTREVPVAGTPSI